MTYPDVAVDGCQRQGQVGRDERREEDRLGKEAVRPPGAREHLDRPHDAVQPGQGVGRTQRPDEYHLRAAAARRVARRRQRHAVRRHDDHAKDAHDDADGKVDFKVGRVVVYVLRRRTLNVIQHARILLQDQPTQVVIVGQVVADGALTG